MQSLSVGSCNTSSSLFSPFACDSSKSVRRIGQHRWSIWIGRTAGRKVIRVKSESDDSNGMEEEKKRKGNEEEREIRKKRKQGDRGWTFTTHRGGSSIRQTRRFKCIENLRETIAIGQDASTCIPISTQYVGEIPLLRRSAGRMKRGGIVLRSRWWKASVATSRRRWKMLLERAFSGNRFFFFPSPPSEMFHKLVDYRVDSATLEESFCASERFEINCFPPILGNL